MALFVDIWWLIPWEVCVYIPRGGGGGGGGRVGGAGLMAGQARPVRATFLSMLPASAVNVCTPTPSIYLASCLPRASMLYSDPPCFRMYRILLNTSAQCLIPWG